MKSFFTFVSAIKIKYRLPVTFIFLTFFTLFIGAYLVYSMDELEKNTVSLYKHPLAVTNAVRDVNLHVITIQLHLKEIVFAKDKEQIKSALQKITQSKIFLQQSLDIIMQQFLGDKIHINKLVALLKQWNVIMNQVVNLKLADKNETALNISEKQSVELTTEIKIEVKHLLEFANNKASEFLKEVVNINDRTKKILIYSFFLLIVLTLILGSIINSSITKPLNVVSKKLIKLAKGDSKEQIPYQEWQDEVGEMARSAEKLRQSANNFQQLSIIKNYITELSNKLQTAKEPAEFSQQVINFLSPLINANHANVYVYNEQQQNLILNASYAGQKSAQDSFSLGEGLVGQCALEKKVIFLDDISKINTSLITGFGEVKSVNMMVIPILLQDRLLAIMEFATYQPMTKMAQELLSDSLEMLSINIDKLNQGMRTQELLIESEEKSLQLQKSATQLIKQKEKIEATNALLEEQTFELEQQTEELKVNQKNLQQQRSSLRVANEELIEKSEILSETKNILQIKANELEKINQYKSEFLANMSHELRTPLNSMLILAQLLYANKYGNLSDDQVESAETIYKSGNKLLEIINDILDIAKVEAGKMTTSIQSFPLEDLLKTLKSRFEPLATERHISYQYDLNHDVPKNISSDKKLLEQILTNLLSNAIKFTKKGSVQLSIGMTESDNNQKEWLHFHVKDSGIGIKKQLHNKIFKSFEQADGSISRRYGGTGLGLPISSQLAQLLGGKISLDSQPGIGSTFTLHIPVELSEVKIKPPISFNQTQTKSIQPAPFEDDRNRIEKGESAILIIEDDIQFAQLLYKEIRQKNQKCIVACEGESGLFLAEQYPVSGIILDLILPGMTGQEVLINLTSNSKTAHIPIHIISAMEDSGKEVNMGAIGFISKPITVEQIDVILNKLHQYPHKTNHYKILVVEDDKNTSLAIEKLLNKKEFQILVAKTAKEALSYLKDQTIDTMILDLGLPDMDGFQMLEQAKQQKINIPPVIIYSAKDLSDKENEKLQAYTDSIIVKTARSPERLIEEIDLFIHKIGKLDHSSTNSTHHNIKPHQLEGKKVLIVDDDMRNNYALSKALVSEELETHIVSSGKEALQLLDKITDIDIVLMDVMMPDMDGYETIAKIRQHQLYSDVPVIVLTAKAMRQDRENSLQAGANEYHTKPVNMNLLLSQIQVCLA